MSRKLLVAIGVATLGLRLALGDVLENARVAQQNLRALAAAFAMYENADPSGRRPNPPDLLYPGYVADALTFWHPGDANAAPTTIDNSLPDALNSAGISFEWTIEAGPPHFAIFADTPIVRDNSAANNEGLFTNFATADGMIETDPPLATPTPTLRDLTYGHLRRLGNGILIYANINIDDVSGYTPADLLDVWSWEESRPRGVRMFESPRTFWNPGDADPLPPDIDNSVLNAPNSAQVSFEYLAPDRHISTLTPETVILRDNTPANNQGFGRFTYFGDGRIEFVPVCGGDTDLDGDVDLGDLAALLGRFGQEAGPPGGGDVDYDGDVALDDLAALLAHFGVSCE